MALLLAEPEHGFGLSGPDPVADGGGGFVSRAAQVHFLCWLICL